MRIRRSGEDGGIGFFAYLGGGARVVSLGIADARVEGRENVGALAGEVLATVDVGLEDARLEDVWAWGRVFGSGGAGAAVTTGVGGLVGRLAGGRIARGWFGGHVEDGDNTGGLVGFAETGARQRIEDSWAMAAVRGGKMVGGLLGGANNRMPEPVIYQSWAAGPVYAPAAISDVGGLVGQVVGDYSRNSFSGSETSGQLDAGDGGEAVNSILTLTVFNLTAGVASTVWDFGGDSNFRFCAPEIRICRKWRWLTA